MGIYWKKFHVCPYYTGDEVTRIHCEGGSRVMFPDKQSIKEYEEQYCASVQGWKNCTMAIMRNEYYQRIYESPQ